MRILILTHEYPPFVGGVGRYCSALAAAAATLGHDVTVYAPRFDASGETTHASSPTSLTVERFDAGTYRTRDLPRVLRMTNRALNESRWDIIHLADWPFALAAARLRTSPDSRLVCTAYGTEILTLPSSRHLQLMRLRTPIPAGARVCAISDYTARLLLATWPTISSDAVRVTPLGVDPWWLESPTDQDVAAMQSALPPTAGRLVVATVARVVPRKGHDAVIRALAKLPAALRSRVEYIAAGPIGSAAYAQSIATQATASDVSLTLTGPLPTTGVRALMFMSTVFAMPGQPNPDTVEGFGLSYLEAGAQGVPSIATLVGGASQAVLNNRTGLVVPANDQAALDAALRRLLTDSGLRESLGTAARAFAADWPWTRVAKDTYSGSERGGA